MKHKLENYRRSYAYWRHQLGLCNKAKSPAHVRGQVLSHLNKSRHRLQNEMKRVAWLLWPETGRPYLGHWMLVNSKNDQVALIGSAEMCVKWRKKATNPRLFEIQKLQPVVVK